MIQANSLDKVIRELDPQDKLIKELDPKGKAKATLPDDKKLVIEYKTSWRLREIRWMKSQYKIHIESIDSK